jgi:hypothetical protein
MLPTSYSSFFILNFFYLLFFPTSYLQNMVPTNKECAESPKNKGHISNKPNKTQSNPKKKSSINETILLITQKEAQKIHPKQVYK